MGSRREARLRGLLFMRTFTQRTRQLTLNYNTMKLMDTCHNRLHYDIFQIMSTRCMGFPALHASLLFSFRAVCIITIYIVCVYSTLILALGCIGLRNQELSKLQKCGVSWYLKLLYYVQMCFHILQVHWLLLYIVLSCGGNDNYTGCNFVPT